MDEGSEPPSKDKPIGGSLTINPFVAWGAWVASRHADDRAPSGRAVLGVLLGIPVALGCLIVALAVWLPK